jgi:hypothetical protein
MVVHQSHCARATLDIIHNYYILMDKIPTNFPEKVSVMYEKGGFMSKYAGDLVIVVIIMLAVFVVVSYFHVKSKMKPIQDDWSNQRCNPSVMPFAGLINAPDGTSSLEYTSENFTACTQTILEELADYSLMPLYYIMNVITEMFQEMQEAVNAIRAEFNSMRNSVSDTSSEIFGRALNVTLPIVPMMQSTMGLMGKAQATMTAGIYTLYGGYLSINSLFMFIYQFVLELLIALVSSIVACFAIGWLFPPVLASGFAMAAFMTILLIPTIILLVIMREIFASAGKSPPGVPSYCFAGDTELELQRGEKIKIKQAKPGMILADGSKITGVMKSASDSCKMYNLGGVMVTNKHRMFDSKMGWISVASHPKSLEIDNFREQFVYCIGTDTKTIKINGFVFADWDEIDERDMAELRSVTLTNDEKPFENLEKLDIHSKLDTGLHPDSVLCLDDGRSVKIVDIDVGDILQHGEIVNSVVKIGCTDIERFEKIVINGESVISCTANVEVEIDSLGDETEIKREKCQAPEFAYHLVTDKGYFKISGLKIGDYNRGIERYLSDDNIRDSYTV